MPGVTQRPGTGGNGLLEGYPWREKKERLRVETFCCGGMEDQVCEFWRIQEGIVYSGKLTMMYGYNI